MKIYTKTGDDGSTALFGGKRVSKADLRVDAYGCVDECNAVLGLVRVELARAEAEAGSGSGCDGAALGKVDEVVRGLQALAFEIGAVLATPGDGSSGAGARDDRLSVTDVERIENWIDDFEAGLPGLRSFILPGGSATAAQLQVARTVCRRAERVLTAVVELEPFAADRLALVILNRLSDLLFVMARVANRAEGVEEVKWRPREPVI